MASRSKIDRQVATTSSKDAEMSDAGSSYWEIDDNNKGQAQRRRAAPVLETDSDEEDLERLVLGDRAGFRAQLFGGDIVGDASRSLDELALAVIDDGGDNDSEDNPFEDAEDAHMFLYDESMQPHTSFSTAKKIKGSGTEDGPDPNAPAWEDSDDERLVVSLAGRTQLRKLRRTEGEDMVNGTVYAARLRQQYLRLNPQPGWAVEADNARLERLQLKGVKSKSKKEKKDKKTKKARRKSTTDNDLSDEVRHSDSDSNLDAASDTSSDSDSSDDDEASYELLGSALPLDALLRSTSAMASASQMLFAKGGGAGTDRARRLRPEVIDIQKTRDIPTPHAGPVGSLSFHPAYNVLLSSSTSSVLHLHQIAPGAHPTPNPLLTSVRVRRTPVRCSAFLADSGTTGASADAHRIVFAGRRRYFHTWDLATGKVQKVHRVQGHSLEHRSMERFRLSPAGTHMAIVATDRKRGGIVNVLDVQTMQWVAQARHESVGGVADLQWWRDGSGMTILGRDGRVGEWSLEARRFVGVWHDDGTTGGTVLALGGGQVAGQTGGPEMLGGDRWVAIGSKTGITNLYDRAQIVETNAAGVTTVITTPTPLRVLEQLITPVTSITFTPDGQLMAFASKHKRDALRLVHLPSATVYRNWPTSKTPLGRITSVAFSRDSDLLAVGNDVGKTRLWEIRG